MTEPTLASIKAIWSKATPGPWELRYAGKDATDGEQWIWHDDITVVGYYQSHCCSWPEPIAAVIESETDVEAIVAAPTHIAWLVAEVERLTAELDEHWEPRFFWGPREGKLIRTFCHTCKDEFTGHVADAQSWATKHRVLELKKRARRDRA